MHATPISDTAATIAVDLAKDVFQLAFAAAPGQCVRHQRLSRTAFAHAFDNVPPRRTMMEACGSAHHWARHFQRLGHTVTLLSALAVRPYVRGNKTGRTDAAGLLEAARCGDIRPVPVKTCEQQGIQSLHHVREFHKAHRTAAINLLRGLLREFGIVIPWGSAKPITIPAQSGRLTVWLRFGGFHHGPSNPRSPQGRIHECNRTVCSKTLYSITCRRSPYTRC
jgi:hypothetical protein